MPSVQQQRTRFTAAPTGAKWFHAAATARPSVLHTDLCTLAENQQRTGVTPSVHPLAGVETDPVLHCRVHLREPTRRRCIQLRQQYLEQLVGQRDERHNTLASPRSGDEAL